MPTVHLSPLFNGQTVTSTGAPASGYKVNTYVAGSSTRLATYTDATGATPQANPIVLNADGYPVSSIWLAAGSSYKFVLTDANGIVKGPPLDVIPGINDTSIATFSQWPPSGLTPTFVSTTSFTVPGDQTTELHVGRRLQFTTTAGTVYGIIATTAFTTLTTVTMTMAGSGVLDSGLSVVNVSLLRNDHPATPSIYGAGTIASNLALGDTALDSNTTGFSNTAVGLNALTANQTGFNNTAIGANALPANTASSNVAVGTNALSADTTGNSNTAIGTDALKLNIGGNSNVAVGNLALTANTAGLNNTAVGSGSLTANTGSSNTAVGVGAGSTITTGSNNTLIGNTAAPSVVGISNEITLGNSSIATLRCQVTSITALSDARDKADIAPLAAGLDFVQRLKPVSYVWNMRDGGKVGIPDTGFIAQELKQVQVDTGIDIPGLVYEENPDRLEAAYGKLLPVMVKAIQDLSAELEALKRIVNNC